MNCWNHHVLKQCSVPRCGDTVARELGCKQGRFSPLLCQCKADTPLSLIAGVARLRPLKVLNVKNTTV